MLSRYTLLSTDLYPTCSRIGLGRQFYIKKQYQLNATQKPKFSCQIPIEVSYLFSLSVGGSMRINFFIRDNGPNMIPFHLPFCMQIQYKVCFFFFFFPHIFCNAFTNVALCIYIYIFSRSMIIFESSNYKNMFCL